MRKIKIILAFIFIFLLLSVSVQASTTARLSGTDRYETSSKIALDGWTKSDYAILASGEDYPDALCATPLAGKYKAPILLTQKNSIPSFTLNVIKQLQIKNIFIIGGTGVVSQIVETELSSMGITVTRLWGQNRYETDIKVAEKLTDVSQIAVVTGEDYADALSISPIAIKENMAIILVPHNEIPKSVKDYLSNHNISKTYVIGKGTSIQNTDGLTNITELNGKDKYQRNIAIINTFKSDLDLSAFYLATGENFPDALSGTILSGLKGNPLMLVGNDITDEKSLLQLVAPNANIKILGGTSAVSDNTINNLISVATNSITLSVTEVAKNVNAVVKIEAKDSNNIVFATGSGFIISSEGKLITNYHVIDGAYFADVILQDGSKYEVDGVLGYSKLNDLAILKLKNASNLPIVKLGDSDTLQLGDQIVAIGSPLGIENTVSTGIISGLNRINSRDGKDIQISVAINHGSSGGALFNMNGQVVGITYLGVDSTGDLNYAIPINDSKPLINISTLTILSQLVLKTAVQINTSNSIDFFPQLSDVPKPSEINYSSTNLSNDGKEVFYNYLISSLSSNFGSDYEALLDKEGWKYSSIDKDSSGNISVYYNKETNYVSVTIGKDYLFIWGDIR